MDGETEGAVIQKRKTADLPTQGMTEQAARYGDLLFGSVETSGCVPGPNIEGAAERGKGSREERRLAVRQLPGELPETGEDAVIVGDVNRRRESAVEAKRAEDF